MRCTLRRAVDKVLIMSAAVLVFPGCGNAVSAGQDGGQADTGNAARLPIVALEQVTAAALRDAADERTKAFYEARNWRAAWTGESASILLAALGDAERHGLQREMFYREQGPAENPARRDAALTKAALDYAEALAKGRVEPQKIHEVYSLSRPDADVSAGLARALAGGKLREWLASLAPRDADYHALSEAYLNYRRQAAMSQGSRIAGGEIIREGDTDRRVPRVVETLRSRGYLPQERNSPTTDLYGSQIAAAVKRLQDDHGITSDGIVGPETLAVLNAGPADRARQLAVNLERRRWLRREPPATRIDVNIAAAMLDLWRDGAHVDRRRVVVGQPGWETPQLGSPIFRLVANPTWTVPKSIEREEIAPKGEAYLGRNNMVRRNGWIVQLPGPDNALGQVKFDMRNEHAIYLHDTPAEQLFRQNERYRSHGCVRVEDALGFARLLAQADGSLARFEEALASGEETFVDLDRHIPVRLVYHTAFVGPDGDVRFRNDVYGWDDELASALGYKAAERRPALPHRDSDVGP